MFYRQDDFPDHIKYVRDTMENRKILKENLGESKLSISMGDFAYIRINIEDMTWFPTFTFQWLYRDTPPLVSIEKFINTDQFENWDDEII